MNLEKTYQSILQDSFRKKYTDWDQIAAVDPVKAFADGVSCALAEVEKRQVRLTDLLVNSLPAFFGFERKLPQAPQSFFQLKETQSLRQLYTVTPKQSFLLSEGSRRFEAYSPVPFDLFPVDNFAFRNQGKQVTVKFSLRAGAPYLALYVLSAPGQDPAAANYLENARLTVSHLDGSQQLWQATELLIEDGSQGATQHGYLSLRPRPGTPLFPERAADYELVLDFAEPFLATDVLFNVVSLALRQVATQVKLGTLQGEPWEQVPLPENFLSIPEAVRISLPHQDLTIHRVEMDLLKIRTAEPERFEKSFFYEPFSHSLIFPGSHRLVGSLNTGLPLQVERVQTALPENFNLAECRFDAGELRIAVEAGKPLFPKQGFIARESQLDFLKRFYTAVRFFNSSQVQTPGVLKEDLERELTGCHPLVRAIEIEVFAREKRIEVHVLTHTAAVKAETYLPDEVVTALTDRLALRVPLDYQYRLAPFRRLGIEVQSTLSVSLPVQRAGVVSESLLKHRIESAFRRLTAPEAFAPGSSLPKVRLGEQIEEALSFPQEDHTHLFKTEINQFELLLRRSGNGIDGVYIDTLHRQAGELFDLKWDTQVSLLAAALLAATPIRNRREIHA